ncbi:hypothetical protein GCM10009092_01570 [Bowmanella denitrificans]|uniref:Uncharacterized protein n=1 Tax=Bowmanella denitrificans TaxID=366582 RepID=A0ABP3GCY5_9ALTE
MPGRTKTSLEDNQTFVADGVFSVYRGRVSVGWAWYQGVSRTVGWNTLDDRTCPTDRLSNPILADINGL